jgi:hypothetical protein
MLNCISIPYINISLHYRVFVSAGVYDLYETGYRDATAITASIAFKLVSLRNEVHPVLPATATATAVDPSSKKSKMTHRMPVDSIAALQSNHSLSSVAFLLLYVLHTVI